MSLKADIIRLIVASFLFNCFLQSVSHFCFSFTRVWVLWTAAEISSWSAIIWNIGCLNSNLWCHHYFDHSQVRIGLTIRINAITNNFFPFLLFKASLFHSFVRSIVKVKCWRSSQIENNNCITCKIHIILRCYWRCRYFLFLIAFPSFFCRCFSVQQWVNKRSMNFYFSFPIHSHGYFIYMKWYKKNL